MVAALLIDKMLINKRAIKGWCETFFVDSIIIANDNIAENEMRSMQLTLEMPKGIKVAIKGIQFAVELLSDSICDELHTLLIVDKPSDALYMLERVQGISNVIVGHYEQHSLNGKKRLLDYLWADLEEYEDFKKLTTLFPESKYQISAEQESVCLKNLLLL